MGCEAGEFPIDRRNDGPAPLFSFGVVSRLVEPGPISDPVDTDHGHGIGRPSKARVDRRIINDRNQRWLAPGRFGEKVGAAAIVR